MTILEWIEKNMAEGADLEEAKKLVKGTNLPQSKEDAAKLVESNQFLKSELDSRVSKSVENATERFKENKLPDILKEEREKIRKELNPEETPEQKRIRELEEKLGEKDKIEQLNQKKLELREKAKAYAEEKGIQYDVTKAEKFAQFGDDAEQVMQDSIDYIDSYSKGLLDSKLKDTYRGNIPKGNSGEPADINEQIAEAKKNGDLQKASSLAFQKAREQNQK